MKNELVDSELVYPVKFSDSVKFDVDFVIVAGGG